MKLIPFFYEAAIYGDYFVRTVQGIVIAEDETLAEIIVDRHLGYHYGNASFDVTVHPTLMDTPTEAPLTTSPETSQNEPWSFTRTGYQAALKEWELYTSLPDILFSLPFLAFDLLRHLRSGLAFALGAVGQNVRREGVEGFQNLGHTIKSL